MSIDLNLYKPHMPFTILTEDFMIKIAESPEDIRAAQKLRHDIFLEEWQGKVHETGLDFDDYDAIADHLMIVDRKNGLLVGTYRLICSTFSKKFYSQNEFHLDEFLENAVGNKLEMGRACTHKDYRNGRTMDLLWQGLSQYIAMTHTRYLFGCSSVTTSDPNIMFPMLRAIYEKDQLKFEFNIKPEPEYEWENAEKLFEHALPLDGYAKQLPPLLRSYLHAGSFIYGMPAYDKDFSCFDLFTVLKLTTLNKRFYSRFEPKDGWGFEI